MSIVGGSSPLARGLLRRSRSHVNCRRIIPARAGFTSSVPVSCQLSADHPRSRGVYFVGPGLMSIVGGSSPLARGLLWACGCRFGLVGIIPARAGFTQCQVPVHLPGPDHPRSRGVYGFEAFVLDGAAGSSPLARGLLWQGLVRPPRRGIIPARAGFTACTASGMEARRDHPRSRGVYGTGEWTDGETLGSSPLARGLRRLV